VRSRTGSLPVERLALWGITIAVLLFFLVPLVIIVVASFGSGSFMKFPPAALSLDYYARLASAPQWLRSAGISLQIAVLCTAITLLIAIPASVALVRGRFPGKTTVFAVLLSPLVVPGIVTALAIFFFFHRLHLFGSIVGIAIGLAATALPVAVIMIAATLQGFDTRLEQAAMGLGASRLVAFRRVTLPLIAPGLVSAALFTFLVAFDELLIPLFLSAPGLEPLSVRIWDALQVNVDPVVAAVSTPLIVGAILVFVVGSFLRGRLANPLAR
jgi:putative spermidine/putrescine transport system permease protein